MVHALNRSIRLATVTSAIIALVVCAIITSAFGENAHAPIARITVAEPTDLARGVWPIVVPITLPSDASIEQAATWRLDRVGDDGARTAVPFQIIDTPIAPQGSDDRPVDRLPQICFLTELAPGPEQVFELVDAAERDQAPELATTIAVEGEGFGVTVATGPITMATDPRSGQLLYYIPHNAGVEQQMKFNQVHRDRPIHWNPDVWAPPAAWGHVSDWDVSDPDRRPELQTARGPLAYRTLRHGQMPTSNGVDAAVSYTFFAGLPFVYESSYMRFTRDTKVNAVRNNELVFNRGIHTHGAWPNEQGEVEQCQLYDQAEPMKFFGRPARIPVDVPWLALFHETEHYGIAIVNLDYHHRAPTEDGSAHDQNACYYFYDYDDWGTGERYDWNFAYMCRSIVSPKSVVASGTTYAERCAFLVFRLGDTEANRFDELLRWARLLREPPTVSIESPAE